MSLVRKLSTLGLRPLVEGACRVLGGEAGEALGRGVTELLARRFGDDSQRLERALREAHERAWKALEIALGGDSFWERCKARLGNPGDRTLRDQLRAFLDSVPADQLPAERDEFRRECLRELRDARQAGLLNPPPLDSRGLAGELGAFARFTEPQRLLQAERTLAEGVVADLRGAGHAFLAQLLTPGSGPSLLVVALRYFLRRAIADDERLARGLTFAQLGDLRQGQEQGFAALHAALADHGGRVEDLLGELHRLVAETHSAVLDLREELARQGEQNRALYEAVLGLQRRLDLMHTELRPRDSLSIRNDGERQLVKQLVARYRALPQEQKRQLPALLNAVGKLEVAAGSFEMAGLDFAALAGLVEDTQARAEAHYNASRAALEARDWDTALREVLQASRLDARRFAPFPLGKYTPQRILGAGGFGVAFLCTHKYMETPVVVKTLLDDLDRGIEQLFAEAQALRKLNHPGIVRVQDCGYTDAANRARPFLVMDYFPGCTLEEHVRTSGVLPLKRFLPLARQVAEALQAAHAQKVLHRDVKPGNLLVRAEGPAAPLQAQLIDFGLALRQSVLTKSAERSGTLMGASIAGTLDYAAPEQLGKLPGTPVGPYSDVYGFGKTCCFALFGTTQPVLKHWQSIPEPLADLLGRCLSDLPGERPADFTAVLRCLDTLNAAPAKPALRKAPPPPVDEEDEDERKELPRRRQAIQTQRRLDPRSRRPAHEEDEEEERERPRLRPPVPPWVWAVVGGGALLLVGLIVLIVAATSSGRSKSSAEGDEQAGPPSPPDPVERRVYLSDLRESEAPTLQFPWHFGKNGDLGEPSGRQMSLAGQAAPKGLGMHPPGQAVAVVKYNLPPAETLWAVAGIADSAAPGGAAGDLRFEVRGDGEVLWKSKPLRRAGSFDVCRVSVKGVKVLELFVYAPPTGTNNGAHAIWLDPYVVSGAEAVNPEVPSRPRKAVREGTRVYLTDLVETEAGSGATQPGKGTVGGSEKKPIRVNGTAYPRGLGVPLSQEGTGTVKYALGKKATALQAQVAVDDSYLFSMSVLFEVVGDGRVLWTSLPVIRTKPSDCLVDLTGVDVLELRVSGKRFGNGPRPVWLDPCGWHPDGVRLPGEGAPVTEIKEGEIVWKDGRAYLSDLKEFDVKAGPWPFSKNGGHGDNGRQSITVGGKAAPKGLSMHPPTNDFSRVRYHLNRQAATLEATVALADSAVAVLGVLSFEVVGDGKLLWKS